MTTAGAAKTLDYTYAVDGQLLTENLNGTLLTTANYDSFGRLANNGVTTPGIAYRNGTALSTLTYAPTSSVTGEGWSFATGQATVSDAIVQSQSGRVLQDTITDSGAASPYTSTYTYDAAGRLTDASGPGNTLTYGFAATSVCGANTTAGADGSRTNFTDTVTGGSAASVTPVAVEYYYDNADRLTSSCVTGAPVTGMAPVLSTPLVSTAGTGQNLTYDTHGDITAIADQAMTYDQTGRHLTTVTSNVGNGGAIDTVSYIRDVTGSAIQMSTTVGAAGTPPS